MQECNTGKHFRACDLYTLAGLKKNKKDQNVENKSVLRISHL